MPGSGLTERHSHLLHHNQEAATPQSSAMQPSHRPPIVPSQQEKKNVREHHRRNWSQMDQSERPASNGGDQERDGRDQDKALVRRRVEPVAERKKDKR